MQRKSNLKFVSENISFIKLERRSIKFKGHLYCERVYLEDFKHHIQINDFCGMKGAGLDRKGF